MDTPENQLVPREETLHIHMMQNMAPGMRGGTGLELGTQQMDPLLNPAVRTTILGNAHNAKTLTLSSPTTASGAIYLGKMLIS